MDQEAKKPIATAKSDRKVLMYDIFSIVLLQVHQRGDLSTYKYTDWKCVHGMFGETTTSVHLFLQADIHEEWASSMSFDGWTRYITSSASISSLSPFFDAIFFARS